MYTTTVTMIASATVSTTVSASSLPTVALPPPKKRASRKHVPVEVPRALLGEVEGLLARAVETLQSNGSLPAVVIWPQCRLEYLRPGASPSGATHTWSAPRKVAGPFLAKKQHDGVATTEPTGTKLPERITDVQTATMPPTSSSPPTTLPSSSNPTRSERKKVARETGAKSQRAPTAASILAGEWSHLVGQEVEKMLNANEQLRGDVHIVHSSDDSVRGGGFIDFIIEANSYEPSSAAAPISAIPSNSINTSASSSPPHPHPSAAPSVASPVVAPLATATSFVVDSIGTINSVFKLRYGTPRQGMVAPHAKGTLTLHAWISEDSLVGLQDFSHIWIVFMFHTNTNKAFHPKISPPRAGGAKLGVFATRTPHRVNPIGLSLVRVDRIDGRTLHLSGLDLLQGTPVIDIKPFHPSEQHVADATFPMWIQQQEVNKPPFAVTCTEKAQKELHALVEAGKLEFYHTQSEAIAAVCESVSLDPRPSYVRTKKDVHAVYSYRLDRMNILFSVNDANLSAEVVSVQYVDYEALASCDPVGGTYESPIERDGAAPVSTTSISPLISEDAITKRFLHSRVLLSSAAKSQPPVPIGGPNQWDQRQVKAKARVATAGRTGDASPSSTSPATAPSASHTTAATLITLTHGDQRVRVVFGSRQHINLMDAGWVETPNS